MKFDKVMRAKVFAQQLHQGQKRRNGERYYNHCERVYNLLLTVYAFMEEDVLCAALLHDVLEDCDVTFEKLSQEFGVYVANLVRECTKVNGRFPNLGSREAKLIKLCDAFDNCTDTDYPGVKLEKVQRYNREKRDLFGL